MFSILNIVFLHLFHKVCTKLLLAYTIYDTTQILLFPENIQQKSRYIWHILETDNLYKKSFYLVFDGSLILLQFSSISTIFPQICFPLFVKSSYIFPKYITVIYFVIFFVLSLKLYDNKYYFTTIYRILLTI